MRHRRLAAASVAALAGASLLAMPSNAGAASSGASASHSKAAEARAALAKMHLHTAPQPGSRPSGGSTTQAYSYNWSGYADVQPSSGTNTYTKVSGKWVQPALTCTNEDQIAVFWVGLDGWLDSTVEQDGTLAQCFEGSAFYYTWWEMYPTNSIQTVGSTVQPGDVITASVTYASGKYTLVVKDATTKHNNISTKQACGSGQTCANSSAEWIAERPSGNLGIYPLADFGSWTVTSAAANTTTTNGHITTFDNDAINMVDGTDTYYLAQPGTASSTSFADTWENSY